MNSDCSLSSFPGAVLPWVLKNILKEENKMSLIPKPPASFYDELPADRDSVSDQGPQGVDRPHVSQV